MRVQPSAFIAAFTFVFISYSGLSFAEETGGVARVLLASPTTTFEGKKVVDNEVLKTVGTLKTGNEGGAKLKLVANDVTIEMSSNSEIKLVLSPSGDASESVELMRGRARLRVPTAKAPKKDKPRFILNHRKVTMGVRGTEFLAIANEELGETELVVVTGEVEFTPGASGMTPVKAGYWAGIGGRFGAKVRGPLKLTPAGVRSFQSGGDIPSFTLEKAPEATPTSNPAH